MCGVSPILLSQMQVLDSSDTDSITRIASILYAVWAARNSALWEAKVPLPGSVCSMADKALHSWRISQPPSGPSTVLHASVHYAQSHYRCHVDAAFEGTTGSKRKAIEQGNTSTSKEPRITTVQPGQEELEQQPTEQAQQPHREQIEEEQPAQADKVDSREQTDAEDDTTRADDDGLQIRALPKILTRSKHHQGR
nr:uncharacterized protein LOC109155268 [Ipomoea batatas]